MSQDILVPGVGLGRGDDRARGRRSAAVLHGRDRLPEHVVLGLGARGRGAARDSHLDRHRERYQPVVDRARPGRRTRSACGVAGTSGKAGATATATAYVTPGGRRHAGDLSRARRAGHAAIALGRAADADRALRRARRDAAAHPRELRRATRRTGQGRRPTTRSSSSDDAAPASIRRPRTGSSTTRATDRPRRRATDGLQVELHVEDAGRAQGHLLASRIAPATRACTGSRRSCWTRCGPP